KPQSTRNRIQGIVTKPEGQVVFIDTPGLHEAKSALGRQMMREVAAALEGIDVLLLLVDASREEPGSAVRPQADELLLGKAQRFSGKTILALNKIDRLPKPKLLPLIESFAKAFEFAAIVPISALKGNGCDPLLAEILKQLPEGEPYFPEERSEEHTSELQSQSNLVCRLLLEKKKKMKNRRSLFLIDHYDVLPALHPHLLLYHTGDPRLSVVPHPDPLPRRATLLRVRVPCLDD